MSILSAFSQAKDSILAYEAQFKKDYADQLDFGYCGSAVLLVQFGRKRKLKNQAIAAGFISEDNEWYSSTGKAYVVSIPHSTVPTQFGGFFRDRLVDARDILNEFYKDTGVEVYIHSWVD